MAPSARVVEARAVALEAFLRGCVARLGACACVDVRAGAALALVQGFLDVPAHVDALDPDLVLAQVWGCLLEPAPLHAGARHWSRRYIRAHALHVGPR